MSDLVIDAKLSKAVYDSYNQNNTATIEGWRPVKLDLVYFKPAEADPQFGAQLYEKDGQYKVVYRGTQPNLADWSNNPAIAGWWQQEMSDTIKFAGGALKYVMDQTGIGLDQARERLSTTGHSQGGFQSELAAKFYGLPGTSLDGPGMRQFLLNPSFTTTMRQEMRNEFFGDALNSSYAIGNFDARIYTVVGRIGFHDGDVNVTSSLDAKAVIAAWLAGPAVGGPVTMIGLAAHLLDHIIATETLRTKNILIRVIGENDSPDHLIPAAG